MIGFAQSSSGNRARGGDQQSPENRRKSQQRMEMVARTQTVPVTLPRVGADYTFLNGTLLRDGEPQPVRAR